MKYISLLIFAILCLLCLSCEKSDNKSQQQYFLQDDLGNEFIFERVPEKIISTAPNLTEILFKLELNEKIIGVTSQCDFPAEAKSKEIIGDMLSLNFEKIVNLQPDLLFITVEGNTKEAYNKLIDLGIKVFVSNPRDLAGIDKTISDFGKIFNIEKIADSVINDFQSRKEKIKQELASIKKTSMFVVSLSPLILAGKNTFINEILIECGLKNIAENSIVPYPVFSREEVLNKNPEFILIPNDLVRVNEQILEYYPEWNNLDALKAKRILLLQPDIFMRPGPRYIYAMENLHERIKFFNQTE
ncbi:MAG: ABC transporter substrate-binding protein [Bacteroidetes bacterium]|nr:ABC transporter substrate-binding protein [Bacteroidota bacterium]